MLQERSPDLPRTCRNLGSTAVIGLRPEIEARARSEQASAHIGDEVLSGDRLSEMQSRDFFGDP